MDYYCECGWEFSGGDENYVVTCRCGKPMKPLMKKTESVAEVPCSDVLSLLLEEAKHLYKCHSESVEHDDVSKEKRYYRRGHRDAYAHMIESIKEAIKG